MSVKSLLNVAEIWTNHRTFYELSCTVFFLGNRPLVEKMSSETDTRALRSTPRRRHMDTNKQEKGTSAASNTPRKKMKVVEDADMEEVAAYVKKHRSSVVTLDAKLDILILQARLRHEHYTKQKVLSPGRKSSKVEATSRVASYLMRKKETVGEIWSNYVNGKQIQVSKPAGNYCRKSTRVPRVAGVINIVQKFVQDSQASDKNTHSQWQRT